MDIIIVHVFNKIILSFIIEINSIIIDKIKIKNNKQILIIFLIFIGYFNPG